MGKRHAWVVLVIFFALGGLQSPLLYLSLGRDNYSFLESHGIPDVVLWLLVAVSVPFALLSAIVVRHVIPSFLPGLYWFGLVGIAFGCGGVLSFLVTEVPPVSGAFCQIGTSLGFALGARRSRHALDKVDGRRGFLDLMIREYCQIPYIQHSRFVLYFGTFVGLSTAVGATCWIAGRLPATNVVRTLVATAAFPACLLSGYGWAWVLQRTQALLQRPRGVVPKNDVRGG